MQKVRELRHNRTLHFHYHNPELNTSVVENTNYGLLKKVTVNSVSGWGVEFEYFRPDYGIEFNEYFLTRAKKIYQNANDVDNSFLMAHASAQTPLDQQYTYVDEPGHWSKYDGRYLEYFEDMAGCAVINQVMCMGLPRSITDGNPCHLTHQEKMRYLGRISDNIIKVERAGQVELTSIYENDMDEDNFDRVVWQNYGGRLDGVFTLDYVVAGPTGPGSKATPGGEKVSTSPIVDSALKGAFPLESAPSELTEIPATLIEACADPGTVSDAQCERLEQPVDHGGIVATNPGTCGPNHRHETAAGTIGKECQFDTDKHTVLPGFKHEFDYFKVSESCEPGDERCVAPLPSQPEVWRTYLTCDQLAAQHLYDVRSSGTVGGSKIDANGDRVEDWEGVEEKRALIETDLRRICTWVKATNREGEVTLYGLNFRAQALVEATRMGDAYHLVQRVFNADGQIAKEWDPRTLQTPLSNTAYTQYKYDEITPESENGWGKRWPSPWATRHNLLRSEYVPASPVYEHDSAQSSTAVYQRYLWEPLFNQVRYIEYGKVINGQDVPISSQRRVYDYQEFATLSEGLHSTETPTDPFIKTLVRQISLGKHWPDEVDQNQHSLDNRAIEVFDGVETTSVPLITGFFFQGIPLVGEDINQDGVVATSGVARGLPIVVIEEDHTQTGQDDAIQSTALSWTINGQLAGVTDPTGVSTRLEYFPRDYQSWRGTTRPDAQTVSTGNTGKLARVFSDRAIAEWPQEDLPPENCKTLTGPYAFLPSCVGGIVNMLDSLNLPTEVKDRITGYGVEEDLTEFRYNAQGHVHRVWANEREEVHWNDADGRLVRLEEGDRVTQLRYTPEAWVNDKRVLENGNLVSHETFAHDRAGNVIGHCVSRTGTSCLNAFSSSFAIGDPSPSGTSRTLFAYDKEDRLSHTSDPLGVVTFSERDALGRVIREYTPDCIGSQCSDDSREVRYEYDLMGRVTAQHYGSETVVQQMGGGSESFAYDGYGRLVTHVDRRLNTWQMAWNKADQLRAKMIYGLAFPAPLLGTEARTWTYGPFGRVEKEVVDPQGAALSTRYYYSRGNVPYKTQADGYAPVYASTDASGRPIVSVDQTEVRVWTYSLDGLEGTETSVALDENGLPDTSVTKRTVVDRHGLPLMSEQINGRNELRRWTFARSYQTNGWKFDQVDPAGRTTSSFTDFAGFKIQDEVATPQGTEITQFTVNARGETREILDPSGGLTKQEFNAFGDRIHLEKPSPTNDDIHQYSFDAYGRLNSWKRHREEVVWTFDSRGDLHQELVINAAGTEVLNAYDWDDAGRQTSSTAFNPHVRDSLGLSVQDARVSVVSNWDDAGRLTLEEMTVGSTSQLLFNDWTLNAQGNWEVHTEQTGLGNFSRTTTLDSAGRRVLDQTAFAFPSSNIAYSWAGRRMTQRVHNGNVSFNTGFNGFGERITHTGTGPNGVFHTETLERDVLGRVRSQTHGSQAWNGQERWQAYEYDARHALSTSWEAWAPTNTAPSVGSHDTATNLSVASAAGGLGATASARERAPTLGSLQKIVQGAQDVWEAQRTASGHRLSEISDSNATWMIEHDPLGRVTAALDKEYEYDPLGKLVLARDTNGDLLESYLMTADGRIVQIQRHDAQGYTASMFAYDGAQMTASFTEGTGGTWTQDWQAVWGPGQDQLLEFHDFHTGKTFAVAQDHRNNVVALLDDATGTLDRVMHYTPEGLSTHYDDAGQVLCDEEASLVVTCTELNMPFGFNGMWRSNTTGLSHMRNRWYSPQLGQFMSHDPLEYIDSYDLYAFAKLDPINFWDPWGLSGGSLVPNYASGGSVMEGTSGYLSASPTNFASLDSGMFIDHSVGGFNGNGSSNANSSSRSSRNVGFGGGGTRFGMNAVPIGLLQMNNAARPWVIILVNLGTLMMRGGTKTAPHMAKRHAKKAVEKKAKKTVKKRVAHETSQQFKDHSKKLKSLVEDLNYLKRPNVKLKVPGGVTGAVRHTKKTEELVGGSTHVKKAQDILNGLKKLKKRVTNSHSMPDVEKKTLLKEINKHIEDITDAIK